MKNDNNIKDETRNLNPHSEARLAMLVWGEQYSKQNGGCMDFWDNLSESDKNLCREWVKWINKVSKEKDWINWVEPQLRS